MEERLSARDYRDTAQHAADTALREISTAADALQVANAGARRTLVRETSPLDSATDLCLEGLERAARDYLSKIVNYRAARYRLRIATEVLGSIEGGKP